MFDLCEIFDVDDYGDISSNQNGNSQVFLNARWSDWYSFPRQNLRHPTFRILDWKCFREKMDFMAPNKIDLMTLVTRNPSGWDGSASIQLTFRTDDGVVGAFRWGYECVSKLIFDLMTEVISSLCYVIMLLWAAYTKGTNITKYGRHFGVGIQWVNCLEAKKRLGLAEYSHDLLKSRRFVCEFEEYL